MRPIFDDRLQWPIVTTVTTVLQRAIVLPPSSSQSAFQAATTQWGRQKDMNLSQQLYQTENQDQKNLLP